MVDRFDGPPLMQPYKNGDFVRYSDYAELEAENARLTFANNTLTAAAMIAAERAEKAEALSRTGAVKVKALVSSLLDLRDLIMRGKRCVTDTGPAVKPVIELAAVHILDDAANALEALSALEPPAPESQQDDDRIRREMEEILRRQSERDIPFAPATRPAEQAVTEAMVEALRNIDAEAPAKEPRDDWTSTDLDEAFYEGKLRGFWEMAVYAREALTAALGAQTPPEGAVTEAMVDAAREIIHGARHVYSDIDLARAALKAAMEAGR